MHHSFASNALSVCSGLIIRSLHFTVPNLRVFHGNPRALEGKCQPFHLLRCGI
nr:MAG TPA: hypothetical protein [Bacteriophage sp.]